MPGERVLMTSSFRSDRVSWSLFLSISMAGFLMRLASTTGLIASDDLFYSRYAQMISTLHYSPELIHWSLRWGLLVPVGIVYRIFGVHEWTTFVVPLLASTVSVPLLMILGERLVGLRAALLAGVLFASFPTSLHWATILIPEPVAELYMLMALIVYAEAEEHSSILRGCVVGLIWGISYLTKEPAVFVAMATVLDAAFRRRWRLAFGICTGLMMIIITECAYYFSTSGDLLFRFHAMKIHEQSGMVIAANQNLTYRLFKSYPRMMLVPNSRFGLHSIFTLILAAVALLRRAPRWQFLILWSALPWLYLNLGSSNLRHFVALPVSDRYIGFCYQPLFLLAGWILDQWTMRSQRTRALSLAAITLVAAIGLWCGYVIRQQGFMTNDVAVLRRIAAFAKQQDLKSVRFVDDPEQRWRRTMAILAPSVQIVSENSSADLSIGRDALGLPTVVSMSADLGK